LASANSRLSLEVGMVPHKSAVLVVGSLDVRLAQRLAAADCTLRFVGGRRGLDAAGELPASLASPGEGKPDSAGSSGAPAAVLVADPSRFDYLAAFGPQAFDVALVGLHLDDVTEPAVLLRAVARTVRPDGRIIISALNAAHGSHRLAALASAVTPKAPTMTWPAITELLTQAGLEPVEARAVIVDLETEGLDLPPGVDRWIRGQKGVYDYEYVVRAELAGSKTAPGGASGGTIEPVPAGPLPDPPGSAALETEEADPVRRIESLVAPALDSLVRQNLRDRDAVIGAEVAAATFRKDLERLSNQFKRQIKEIRIANRRRETQLRRDANERIRHEREAIRRRYERSTSWRLGRLLLLPLRAAKRLVRRR
jgi:2-polyprenyl-3-methyl-5-hydroxy-6-metoxy-1,4-benzoquinol methylase